MDHNNTLILDADDTDIPLINNELVQDALLLMGECIMLPCIPKLRILH
jgi:hypothetical protein